MKNLTAYELSCGALQRAYPRTDRNTSGYVVSEVVVSLWREHGAYHVRCNRRGDNAQQYGWQSFRRLGDARKHFSAVCKWAKGPLTLPYPENIHA